MQSPKVAREGKKYSEGRASGGARNHTGKTKDEKAGGLR